MEQIKILGTNASGTIPGLPLLGIEFKSIEIDIPLDEIGTTDPTVTISGSRLGSHTFHGDSTLNLRTFYNEDIYLTTSNFTSEYSAIIRFEKFGDMGPYMQTDANIYVSGYSTPWRFREGRV